MQRKIHHFAITQDGNQLRLQVIEMIRNDNTTALGQMTKLGLFQSYKDIDFVVDAIYDGRYMPLTPFNGLDIPVVAEFNHLPGNREDNRENLRTQLRDIFQYRYGIINDLIYAYNRINNMEDQASADALRFINYQEIHATDYFHPNDEYTYRNIVMEVPNNPQELLKLLGALADLIHRVDRLATDKEYKSNLVFCDKHPDFSQPQRVIGDTLKDLAITGQPTLPSIIRFVARQIVTLVTNHPEQFAGYEIAAHELFELLKQPDDSLARTIREKLYPDPSIEDYLTKTIPNETLICSLLNPKTRYEDATSQLMTSLSTQLKYRVAKYEDRATLVQWFLWAKEIWTSTPYVNTSTTSKGAIHANIQKQFDLLLKTRDALWQQTVTSLFGHKAPDGKNFHEDYTEVQLLKQAGMHLNSDGLMELDIYETPSYKKNYATGKWMNDKLEEEVRAACQLLNLDILPGDFHQRIVFTRDSTIDLMNRAMHYSEDYAKALMRTSHRFRLFKSIEDQRKDMPRLPLDIKTRILREAAFKDQDAKPAAIAIELDPAINAEEADTQKTPPIPSTISNVEVRMMKR